jgi:hypothetical protein
MGYEARMQADILALLQLFRDHVPDTETNAWVIEVAGGYANWPKGHDLVHRIRKRNLKAIDSRDYVRECQYCFEEVCLQSLYNETHPRAPFDSCSPYWVIKNAIVLARVVGVPVQEVLAIVAPET